ncbi:MAG: type I-E CRISPR-associated protein Cas5/CasD [Solidesulfovibrio sp. DCME]|uniref:type I-E CRISPR-associated protein Cas5/CasD n=1 Tax=Solidesulfovibrio sp. DCME TaxID=3447380 RepID=UPI003D13FB63
MTEANALFLRLEGPFQAWGDTSKFVIRRTLDAPTKSGVLGLICCAMGLSRQVARGRLSELNRLAMGVRIDRHGTRWWDYQTVGAGIGMTTAGGGLKTGAQGTLVTRREYLADASFLVALQGDAKLVHEVAEAIASPKWPVFLGRKSCPPSVPVLAKPREGESWTNPGCHDDLIAALGAVSWHPRYKADATPHNGTMEALVEWRPASGDDVAPDDAEVWYDVPVCFDPPVHEPRFILRDSISPAVGEALQGPAPAVPRPRADYTNAEYRKRREERIKADAGLCVFCKSPGPRMTVQHVTYRRAGGNERLEDLRSLCGLCHDAITMLEYGLGMGLDRINPEDPRWRERIIQKRAEILKFRSLETRRRRLAAEEVE